MLIRAAPPFGRARSIRNHAPATGVAKRLRPSGDDRCRKPLLLGLRFCPESVLASATLGAIIGGLYGAEACLYLAAAIFAAQAIVILMSPAVSLKCPPEMVGEPA